MAYIAAVLALTNAGLAHLGAVAGTMAILVAVGTRDLGLLYLLLLLLASATSMADLYKQKSVHQPVMINRIYTLLGIQLVSRVTYRHSYRT